MATNGRESKAVKQGKTPTSTGRRRFLKTAAVTAGAAASTGLVDGFPLVWSQNIKDITLVHVGGSYSAIIDIAKKASEDLGFKVEMQTAPHDALLSRLLTQPNTIDIADIEYFFQYYMIRKGTLQPIDLEKRFKWWDKVVPIFSKGQYPDGRKVSSQGCLPYEVQYVEGPGAKDFAKKPTKWATGVPTVYNADTLGIRPDKVKKIESWSELLNPSFKGKTAIVSVPSIGIMDAAMAIESRGDIKYGDKGDMTKQEIDKTIEILTKAKKDGQFRAFWKTFDESVNLMAAGETVVQSMWSPAVTAVRSRGIPCYYAPLKEGYRAWASCLGLMSHLKGPKLDAAYEYLNWYMSGWQGARGGRKVGYLNASCSGGRLQVKGKLKFENGDLFPALLTSPCRVVG
jgi:putative spermidine/putrescine transport system substrate-binding protein